MTTIEQAKEMIKNFNNKVDDFINNELPKQLGCVDGRISLNDWFKAQALIQKQDFYNIGHTLQVYLRTEGHDVKMDMQSNKLVY